MNSRPDAAVIRSFNAKRSIRKPYSLCYAPSISLNFDQSGVISACCFNRQHVLGTYPQNTVAEAWNGKPIQDLRNALAKDDLNLGCQQCGKMLSENNFESVLIRHFDDYTHLSDSLNRLAPFKPLRLFRRTNAEKPVMFEFEISNHCNLECIMCGGKWSSAIRKNREKLPPLRSPYDERFVTQIREFLPTLSRANFLGGEPFLISLYYDIWEAIIEINPSIDVAITSNGTMLNSRGKKIIESLKKCRITLSIDSLRKETWETIRQNGEFEVLKTNIDWMLEKKKLRSFSVCPMIQNWREIPEIMQFCADHDLDIYFNIVYGPLGGEVEGIHTTENQDGQVPRVSLQHLGKSELTDVIDLYEAQTFPSRQQVQLNHLVAQLRSWRDQKQE